jgi:hypothetical protein
MIESPVVKRWQAEAMQGGILAILQDRFGKVPREVPKRLQGEIDEKKLTALAVLAAKCPDIQAYREALLS